MRALHQFLQYCGLPETNTVSWSERARSTIGVVIGLAGIVCLGLFTTSNGDTSPWIIASIGASAYIVFVLPSSPLAQPWAVIAGSFFSALVALTATYFFQDKVFLIPLSVGLAILVMFVMRCLHPPAAALALLIPLNGFTDFHFLLFPVLANVVLLVLVGAIYNSLSGKPYPYRPKVIANSTPAQKQDRKIEDEEIDAVLARYNQVIDVNKEDLANLITQVEQRANHKKLKSMLCKQMMTTTVKHVSVHTSLDEAWKILRSDHVKALPVIDADRRVLGIITLEGFIEKAAGDFQSNFGKGLKALLRTSISGLNKAPQTAGQIMSAPVKVISQESTMLDLMGIFCGAGHHHIPVVNADAQLVGMITQSDFIKAIEQSVIS